MERIATTLALFGLLLLAACGATADPQADPPRLVVAYVDEASDIGIRGEPDGRSWRFSSDGVVFGLSWSPSADRLLITERLGDDWQLSLIETAGFTTVAVVPLHERPGHRVTWRGDGAAFVLSGADFATAYSRTGRALWSVDRSGIPLGWSPDGRWFAFGGESVGERQRLIVTDGKLTHEVTPADLGVSGGLGMFAGVWLVDGTMSFETSVLAGGTLESTAQVRELKVSDQGVELGDPVDPSLGVRYWRASEARDTDGETARETLVAEAGGPDAARGSVGGLHWVSARYDDSEGHHRVFALRSGAILIDERITIDFGDDPFPQIAAAARASDDD